MQKLILALAIMFINCLAIQAQKLSIQGGLNFTNVSSEKDIDLGTSNGFHLGLGVEFALLSPINIGSGLYYTRRGYESNVPGREGNVFIDYLDIPVDFMLKLKPLDLVGAFVSVGPYFSYGVNSKVFNANDVLEDGFSKDDIDLNRLDSGINIGAGVDITRFRLSGAYGISLTDNGAETDNELKNRVFKLTVGYFFQ